MPGMELPRARRTVIVGLLRMLVLGVEFKDGVRGVVTPLANGFDFGLSYPWTTSFVFVFASPFTIIAVPFPFPITDFTDFFLSSQSVNEGHKPNGAQSQSRIHPSRPLRRIDKNTKRTQ